MLRLYVWLRDLIRHEGGQDLVEYALIAALAASIIVAVVTGVISGVFGDWANDVGDCISPGSTTGTCPFS